MTRIQSINEVIVPFRAPEIHNDILNFPMEKYFYFDQDWDVQKRFEVLDNFKETFLNWVNLKLPNYNFYPVNGSTEALTRCLLKLSLTNKKLAMVENEYRWYPYIASKYGIKIVWLKTVNDLTSDCVFVTSLPFCRDGKVHDLQHTLLEKCHNEEIECWIDCAYYGTTKPVQFIIPKSTTNIFFSFSKNFGMALNRIGIWLSKEYITDKGLLNDVGYFPIGNMALVTKLMKTYPVDFLWNTYRNIQLQCTTNPTDLIFMSYERCLSGDMTQIVKERYQSL